MKYEVCQDSNLPDVWRVEAFDSDGTPTVMVFSGPKAESLAREFAGFKNWIPLAPVTSINYFSEAVHYVSRYTKMKPEIVESIHDHVSDSALRGFVDQREMTFKLATVLTGLYEVCIEKGLHVHVLNAQAILADVNK